MSFLLPPDKLEKFRDLIFARSKNIIFRKN